MTKVESGTGLVLPQREEQPRLRHSLLGPRGWGVGVGRGRRFAGPVSGLADRVGGLPSSRGSRSLRDFLRKEPKEREGFKSQSQRTQQKQALSDQVSGMQGWAAPGAVS